MYFLGDEGFSSSTFTEYQNIGVAFRGLHRQPLDFLHGQAASDNFREQILRLILLRVKPESCFQRIRYAHHILYNEELLRSETTFQLRSVAIYFF